MQHFEDPLFERAAEGLGQSLAYRLGGPRFAHHGRHYLSVPIACRRDAVGLLTGVALAHARDWLERHDVDPRTRLLDDGMARIVDLDWPTVFRDANPAAADAGRLQFGWRHLVEFAAGDMLAQAVRWGRLGGGRLVPLAELR